MIGTVFPKPLSIGKNFGGELANSKLGKIHGENPRISNREEFTEKNSHREELTGIQTAGTISFLMTAFRQMPACMNNMCCSCVLFGTSGG